MNKAKLAVIAGLAISTIASNPKSTIPPEFEVGCEASGNYSYVYHAEPDKALEVEEWTHKVYLTTERTVWEAEHGYSISVCIETTHPEEDVWLFYSDGALVMNSPDEYQIELIAIQTEQIYFTYLPLVSN